MNTDNPNLVECNVHNYAVVLESLRAEGRQIEAVDIIRGGYRLRLRPLRLTQPELAPAMETVWKGTR